MAKVTDIQDKNGVSKEIQDKDLSRQTAATAIASTDYVMLQDTSGGYHKIAKASFTEAVRSALGSVINSTAKGTDIAKVPVLDSNNDLGMGTLANIASVLGDTQPIKRLSFHIENGKYLEINFANGFYPIQIDVSGYQPNFSGLIQIARASGYTLSIVGKLVTGGNGNNKVYYTNDKIVFYTAVTNSQMDIVVQYPFSIAANEYTTYDTSSMKELSWKAVANFGCDTPADLASLLGVGKITFRENSSKCYVKINFAKDVSGVDTNIYASNSYIQCYSYSGGQSEYNQIAVTSLSACMTRLGDNIVIAKFSRPENNTAILYLRTVNNDSAMMFNIVFNRITKPMITQITEEEFNNASGTTDIVIRDLFQ